MSVKITYFVHGTTKDNEDKISSGWSDVELSDLGVKHINELKEKVKDKNFDVVFCSDLKRARKSAELIWGGKVKIISDNRLRECNYGELNGKSSEIVEPMQEKMILEKFPNGESYEDVKQRVSDFLEMLKKNYKDKNVAILSHKGPQLALDVLLKGKNWEQAFKEDWRHTKSWQPGWRHEIN